jgi:hypothetical protein
MGQTKVAALSGTGDAVYRKLIARSFGRDLAIASEPRARLDKPRARAWLEASGPR